MSNLRIFISSTCYDLSEVRSQLGELCREMGHDPVLSENGDILYDPRLHTYTSCLRQVESADFVVAIIGGRFGGQAIPEAMNYAASATKFIPEEYQGCSITQLEILYGIELGIPVFPFVLDPVLGDHNVYKANLKKGRDISSLILPSISKRGTEKLIFEFIDLIRLRARNNVITPFSSFNDIRAHLKRQWSSYFQVLVNEERKRNDLKRKFDEEGDLADDDVAEAVKTVGIRRLTMKGSIETKALRPLIRSAKSLKIIFVSADTFVTTHLNDIRECLEAGGDVRLIVATPDSEFIHNINLVENRPKDDGISPEISDTIKKIKRAAREARINSDAEFKVSYGYFTTQLRLSLIIIDDRICHVILNYPPKRTSESLGITVEKKASDKKGLAVDLISHFDLLFRQLSSSDGVTQINA